MHTFWHSLIRFEREKIAPGTALRNALGVAIPLLSGALLGHTASGLMGTTGALNVSFTDGRDPYIQRAERMVAASLMCGVAVAVGGFFGSHDAVAIAISLAWAFTAGILVSLDQAAADIGTISLVTLVVFSAHPMSPSDAAWSGVLAFCGGLLQTLLAVALWPVHRYEPEQRALIALYQELARAASAPVKATAAPPATAQVSEAQTTLARIAADRNVQAERYLLLLSQAERIRLSLLFLGRLRVRLERESEQHPAGPPLDHVFELASSLLNSAATAMAAAPLTERQPPSDCLREMHDIAEQLRSLDADPEHPGVQPTLAECVHQIDALAGQLRAAMELASFASVPGRQAFEQREARRPWHLRLVGTLPTLAANLTLESTAFRHAIRLAVCVALADGIGRATGWERTYWIPMTVAIVLKPDFTSTFSRGLLRLAGTVVGLVLATALFHWLPVSFATEFLLIVLFVYLLRAYGPANYGVFTVLVSALVVALLAVSGVPPAEAVSARGLNTLAGGVLALIVYAAWPTWERRQTPEMMARMLDAYRAYFFAVREAFRKPQIDLTPQLDAARHKARLARSNLEASVDRARVEPGPERTAAWTVMLASSHRLVHAIMALEAALSRSEPVPARREFLPFAFDVEITMHSLAEALRGSALKPQELPDLRESQHRLSESGDALTERYALVNIESDRITNSLNTLAGQIVKYLSGPAA